MAEIKVAHEASSTVKTAAKKPYVKPALRPLGTVRELTQTGVSGNKK